MKELGRFFRTYCNTNHKSWPNYLQDIEDCFNHTPHLNTAYSATQILTGRRPPRILTRALSTWLPPRNLKAPHEVQREVYHHLWEMAERRRKAHNKKIRIFHIGDLVLLKANRTSNADSGEISKFCLLYDGPYIVAGQKYPNVYLLKDPSDGRELGTYNTENLKLFHQKPEHGSRQLPS